MNTIDYSATTRFLSDISKQIDQDLRELCTPFIGVEYTPQWLIQTTDEFTYQLETRYGHLYNQQQYSFRVNVTPSEHSPSNILLSWGLCERSAAEEESQGLRYSY